MIAWLALRDGSPYRRDAFSAGLKRLGYRVCLGRTMHPGPSDILVIWNRYGESDHAASRFEEAGLPVIVAENATWGKEFAGDRWYSLTLGAHNTRSRFPIGDHSRFDSLGVDLMPWRTEGETVVLMQRGIGPAGVAMPRGWTAPGRIRRHPGLSPCVPLAEDLAQCGRVVTWGSGAAVKALTWGIPVESHMPNWIAQQDNTDAGRLAMFRELAWSARRISEIESGEAFEWLLKSPA